jgi:hypothetical protein
MNTTLTTAEYTAKMRDVLDTKAMLLRLINPRIDQPVSLGKETRSAVSAEYTKAMRKEQAIARDYPMYRYSIALDPADMTNDELHDEIISGQESIDRYEGTGHGISTKEVARLRWAEEEYAARQMTDASVTVIHLTMV